MRSPDVTFIFYDHNGLRCRNNNNNKHTEEHREQCQKENFFPTEF